MVGSGRVGLDKKIAPRGATIMFILIKKCRVKARRLARQWFSEPWLVYSYAYGLPFDL